jgi:histidine triad (HIT) family protein
MDDCIFCKIVRKEAKTDIEVETKYSVVFKSAFPKAPIHLLIVSKKHAHDISEAEDEYWLDVKKIALDLAKKYEASGFRLVNNFGKASEVKHLHVHFLAEVGAEREL